MMERQFYLFVTLAILASTILPASAIMNDEDASRQKRSLNIASKIPIIGKIPVAAKAHIAKIPIIGSFFGLEEAPVVPNLGTYPLWKVHRYHGISLQPVAYPAERIPSNLPVPPILPGEAPSIVNVPNPNYADLNAPIPPANEYGLPASGYSSASSSVSAAAPASASASASASSSASASLSASPSPVYSVPLTSRDPRGPVSTSAAQSAAFSLSGGSGFGHAAAVSDLNLSVLQTMLPPELFSKVQVYASTPGGSKKIRALLKILNNAKKLKLQSSHSIQGMFQTLFGGAGGSTDVALDSGTWVNIPGVYPATQGVLNHLRPFGTGISGSLLPTLPDVPSLPEIAGIHTLPPIPELPLINMPDITPLSANGIGGGYVSINFPKTPQIYETVPQSAAYTPAQSNSQSAAYAPAQSNSQSAAYAPAQSNSQSAAYSQVQSNSQPAHQYAPPAQQYSPPSQEYSPPVQHYSPPSQEYSPPVQHYGSPSPQYSVPEIPSTSYGTPVGPVYSYPQTSGSSSSSYFQGPQKTYGAADATFAASEPEQNYEGRHSETQDEAKAEEIEPQIPLKTTKLHVAKDSQIKAMRNEAFRAYLEARKGFRPSQKDENKKSENEVNEESQN